jgi:hypothetical protein
VWAAARRLAGGDPVRIEILCPSAVVVHNNPGTTPVGEHLRWSPEGQQRKRPKVTESAVWYVSDLHIREPWHRPVLLHLADCDHFYTAEERAAHPDTYTDPELRPATDAELARTRDEHSRVWRRCQHCARRASG